MTEDHDSRPRDAADEPRPLYLSNRDPDDETDAFEDDGPDQLAA